MDYKATIERGEKELLYLEEDFDKGIITWEEYCEMKESVENDIKYCERKIWEEEEDEKYSQKRW